MACTYVKSNGEAGAPYWPAALGSPNNTCPTMSSIQQLLKDIGWYSGAVDGRPGTATAAAIQRSLAPGDVKGFGQEDGAYMGPADGVLGRNSAIALQNCAKHAGGYGGPIDGDPREASWNGYKNALQNWKNFGYRV